MDSGLIEVLTQPIMWALWAVVAANFLLGVLAAIFTGKFELARIGDISKRVVIYVLPVMALYVVAFYAPGWQVAATALYGVVMAALTAHIVAALGELGLPIPDDIMQHLKKIP